MLARGAPTMKWMNDNSDAAKAQSIRLRRSKERERERELALAAKRLMAPAEYGERHSNPSQRKRNKDAIYL